MQPIREEDIIAMEKGVWDAITRQDVTAFQALVAEDAWMVIGGMRSSGAEEARLLPQIHFPPCVLSEFRVKALSDEVVLLHYTATFGGENSPMSDFAGSYYVSSVWQRRQEGWKMVFNQDVRPTGGTGPQ